MKARYLQFKTRLLLAHVPSQKRKSKTKAIMTLEEFDVFRVVGGGKGN
jgi:hypothetical protein